MKKPSRNEPCPCNSGRKYKHCCQKQDEAKRQALSSAPSFLQYGRIAPGAFSVPAIPHALDIAIEHHQAGNLSQAEKIYRQILQVSPNHPGALHFLGLVAKQSGQLEAAAELIGRSLAYRPDYAEAHGNLGSVLSQLGRLEQAVASYRTALSLKPDLAEAHANLGNTLMQQHKLDEAATSYGRALALKPDLAELHNNLGNIFYQQGKLNDAVASYRLALRYKPAFAEAHNNLANVLNELGKLEDAVTHYRGALVDRPQFPEACNNLGNTLRGLGKMDEAIASYRAAITLRPHYAAAHKNLGDLLRKMGDLDEAVASYQRALQCSNDPEITEGFALCIKNVYFTREIDGLRPWLARALSVPWARPAELANPAISLLRLSPGLGQLIERANRAWPERLSHQKLFEGAELSSLPSSLHSGDATGAIPSVGTQSTVTLDLTLVCNDILLRCLLENTPVCDIGLERFLTMARYILLDTAIGTSLEQDAHDRFLVFTPEGPIERGVAGNAASFTPFVNLVPCNTAPAATVDDEQALIFYCALARQCFINEYVFECTTSECDKTEVLRERIAAMLAAGSAVPALWIIAFAAYHPLIALPSAQTLLGSFPDIHAPSVSARASGISGSPPASAVSDAIGESETAARQAITALLVQQVCEPMEEKGNRALIPCLTPLTAGSRRVQHQYEQNPYPRWVKLPVPAQQASFEDDLRHRFPFAHFQSIGSIGPIRPMSFPAEMNNEGIDILVAGCGTGQHSIATRQRYRNARVLAVDLSLASLCYAKRKANESGLNDITHAQADIMALDPAVLGGRTFDLIESVGVLHHLADPFAGWRKLLGLLRPGGFMRLGFYSKLSRKNEMAAQDFARNLLASFGRDAKEAMPEDIRQCRQAIMATGNACAFRQVLSARDFYTMSECRDLLFHVQEHCYTLPQLREQIAQLGLSFVGFSLDCDTLARYSQSFPNDSAQTDLDNWHLFETRNPGTFAGMYQFWVQKG